MNPVNNKLRIGIIGCGFIANQKHLPGLKVIEEVELVAFCDLIEEKAEKACKKYGAEGAKVYTDYKEVLADETIDIIHVCTPNRSHSFITVDALEAGKHVMCEKPMAINSAEALKMIEAAKRTGKKLTIGYQNRQRCDIQLVRNKIDKEDILGEVYYARAIAIRRRGVPDWGVFTNEYEQGGGPLIDIGTHSLDLSLWLMNNYKPLYCVGKAFKKLGKLPLCGDGNWDPEMTVEDSAFGFVVMENGAVISVEAAWAINLHEANEAMMVLAGTKGGVDLFGGVRFNGTRDGKRYEEVFPFDAYQPALMSNVVAADDEEDNEMEGQAEARQWIDAILNDTTPCVLPEQAYVVTRILEGIYESSKTGDIYRF
ncbi:MAG: Gfo/Idh/MocA family oxidoreductase [Clostridia bacterium]|nr:Gfo/Idh/MocA family oxidoreductase [Clostridia bacterium]MBQ9921822.1 Gfo/Idh/MocA family oxidoreductase [Clostridia bacterium]